MLKFARGRFLGFRQPTRTVHLPVRCTAVKCTWMGKRNRIRHFTVDPVTATCFQTPLVYSLVYSLPLPPFFLISRLAKTLFPALTNTFTIDVAFNPVLEEFNVPELTTTRKDFYVYDNEKVAAVTSPKQR